MPDWTLVSFCCLGVHVFADAFTIEPSRVNFSMMMNKVIKKWSDCSTARWERGIVIQSYPLLVISRFLLTDSSFNSP